MAVKASATNIFPHDAADEPLLHGGDLGAARLKFPGAPEPFIDLSTGINPSPYPVAALPDEVFARLPDAAATTDLVAAASTYYGAPSAAHVVPAPGTQLLLPLVAGLARPGRAAVLSPTYNEHGRCASLAGHRVTETRDLAALSDADLAAVPTMTMAIKIAMMPVARPASLRLRRRSSSPIKPPIQVTGWRIERRRVVG